MAKQIFLNLPVKDLQKSISFFTNLGFTFNPQFTDENATCMIIGENINVMLLVEKFFQTFTKKEIANAHQTTEAIIAISVDSRDKVDQMVQNATDAGGSSHREVKDHGWMYEHGFQDLDGHLWEVLYIDETQSPG
ncbi:MAG: VOC family protein [Bacteroidota bacterium]|nr:VOC family protein [Bacteroidota bacterium]